MASTDPAFFRYFTPEELSTVLIPQIKPPLSRLSSPPTSQSDLITQCLQVLSAHRMFAAVRSQLPIPVCTWTSSHVQSKAHPVSGKHIARWGCSLVFLDHHLYIYGGRGPDQCCRASFHKVTLNTFDAAYIKTSRFPRAREGHSCVIYKDELYVYGGCDGGSCDDETYFADLNVYDELKEQWRNIRVKGDIPTGRDNHACGVIGDYMLIYGGNTVSGLSDDIYTFSFPDNTWTKRHALDRNPGHRESAGYCVHTSHMYLFGGNVNSDPQRNDLCSDDFFTLSLVNEHIVCGSVTVIGTSPPPRGSHTLTAVSETLLAMYGGERDGVALKDVWLFYIDYCCWMQTVIKTPLPTRMAHSAVACNGQLLVFGGMGGDNLPRSELFTVTFHTRPSISSDLPDTCLKCQHSQFICSVYDEHQGFQFPNFSFCSLPLTPTQMLQEAADSYSDPHLSLLHIVQGLGMGEIRINVTKLGSESEETVLLVQGNSGLQGEVAVANMSGKWVSWIAAVAKVAVLVSRWEGVLTVVVLQIGEELATCYKLVLDQDGTCLYPDSAIYPKTLDIISQVSKLQPRYLLLHSSGTSLYLHTHTFREQSKVIASVAGPSLSLAEFLQYAWQHPPYPQTYSVSGRTVQPITSPDSATQESTPLYLKYTWREAKQKNTLAVYYENRLVYLTRKDEGKKGRNVFISLLTERYLRKNSVVSRQTLSLEQAWELIST